MLEVKKASPVHTFRVYVWELRCSFSTQPCSFGLTHTQHSVLREYAVYQQIKEFYRNTTTLVSGQLAYDHNSLVLNELACVFAVVIAVNHRFGTETGLLRSTFLSNNNSISYWKCVCRFAVCMWLVKRTRRLRLNWHLCRWRI